MWGSTPGPTRAHAPTAVDPSLPSADQLPGYLDKYGELIASLGAVAEMAQRLRELGALTGMSDHGVGKSLYGRDPDGNEFEVMWRVPR